MAHWLLVRVTVDEGRIDEAENVLTDAGAVSLALRDAGDAPVLEPPPEATPVWPQTIVEGLFEAAAERAAIVDAITAAGLVNSPTDVAFQSLADRDWERVWMDQFRPMQFGTATWICPSHLEPDPDWPVVIRLDPGLAFGSGTHPTTALCLEWIDSNQIEGTSVIDYGCGSGILAIACALKGATTIIAVDHDPQALSATMDNAARNAVADRITIMLPDEFGQLQLQDRRADIVLANILAGPLIELAPRLAGCLDPGGRLVLSGILPEQAEAVSDAYRTLTAPIDKVNRDGWVRLAFAAETRAV